MNMAILKYISNTYNSKIKEKMEFKSPCLYRYTIILVHTKYHVFLFGVNSWKKGKEVKIISFQVMIPNKKSWIIFRNNFTNFSKCDTFGFTYYLLCLFFQNSHQDFQFFSYFRHIQCRYFKIISRVQRPGWKPISFQNGLWCLDASDHHTRSAHVQHCKCFNFILHI